ncbi:MAG: restriction endonuclease [Pseudonocardiaceae bacterium]
MTDVPTWEQFVVPVLTVLSDGETHAARQIHVETADLVGLSDESRREVIPSGQQRYVNRVNWAMSYLARAGAAERPVRGSYRIAEAGRRLLAEHPGGITEKHLADLAGTSLRARTDKAFDVVEAVESEPAGILDPVEQIETGIARIEAEIAAELLTRLHGNEPAFFERAVLDLLIAMGYGGTEGRATRTQLSNDGGIDGIVDQDALGLSRIYVQAKRYALDASVGRPEIQGFVGALHGNQANQGVFITTGRFSRGATEYAASVASRVILIDGRRLASLMISYGVGVQVKRTLHIVDIDEDFFE